MAHSSRNNSSGKASPNAIQYFDWLFGWLPRTPGRAPIYVHQVCGRLLHSVARATAGRQGATEPIKFAINILDGWAMHEYPDDELDSEMLAGLYCPGARMKPEAPVGQPTLIARLEAVKAILSMHYPDGPALKKLFRELDRAIASISKWDGKPRGKVYREPIPQG